MLEGKNIILGVSGGIAAYKACELVSRLKKLNANVDVIMTQSATNFVTPLTFQSLSLNQVIVDNFSELKYWEIEHISLAKKADIIIVAPATANIIGKVANGIADDMLSTTIMATKASVVFAPSMNTNMYLNRIVQNNIEKLKSLGYLFIEPAVGRLACGDIGQGKMEEPEFIEQKIIQLLIAKSDLASMNILVTAGPTQEAIDPVRYISNHSTGKMGFAIAERAAARGAKVTLISGPTKLATPIGVLRIDVVSGKEMFEKVMEHFVESDIIIKSAAVADYTPAEVSTQKLKKKDDELNIKLNKNTDILFELGRIKGDKVLVGFAMETQDLIENAKSKLDKKNADLIIANDLNVEGAGFGTETNVVTIINKNGIVEKLPMMSKIELANIILDKAFKLIERT